MEEGFISAHRMRVGVHLGGKAWQEAAAGRHNCMRFAFTSANQEAEQGMLVLNLLSVVSFYSIRDPSPWDGVTHTPLS